MSSGNREVYNFNPLVSPLNEQKTSGVNIVQDTENQVCPYSTYWNEYGTGCYKDPFISQQFLAFPVQLGSTVYYILTSEYSQIRN